MVCHAMSAKRQHNGTLMMAACFYGSDISGVDVRAYPVGTQRTAAFSGPPGCNSNCQKYPQRMPYPHSLDSGRSEQYMTPKGSPARPACSSACPSDPPYLTPASVPAPLSSLARWARSIP